MLVYNNNIRGEKMIKSYLLVVKQDEKSQKIAESLRLKLKNILIYDDENPDLIISIGGDGTMLYALHQYYHLIDYVYFLGVHTGTLGFYTDYMASEIDDLVLNIQKGKYELTHRSLLEAVVYKKEGNETYYALNEVRIENTLYTQVLDIYINNEHLETFRGNGICVSTPSGSTAYNKSLGGSVIHPCLQAMQLTEIAGIHHNAYRSLGSSLILSQYHTVTLSSSSINDAILGVDQHVYDLTNALKVEVKIAKNVMTCIQYRPLSFVSRIKRSFITG